MKKRRVFIAINIPENIRKKLADFRDKWPEIPAKWAKKDNLHITLSFLGYLSDEQILEICGTVKKIAQKQEPFLIKLSRVTYGPPNQSPQKPPKMVWIEGQKNPQLANLISDLENALEVSIKADAKEEDKEFSPHITLARILQWEFKAIEPEERPEINEEIKGIDFEVNSIEIMESELKGGGPEYTILESISLSN